VSKDIVKLCIDGKELTAKDLEQKEMDWEQRMIDYIDSLPRSEVFWDETNNSPKQIESRITRVTVDLEIISKDVLDFTRYFLARQRPPDPEIVKAIAKAGGYGDMYEHGFDKEKDDVE
jgi:hypothetical protein